MISGPDISAIVARIWSKKPRRDSVSAPLPLPVVIVMALSGPYCRSRKSSASPSSIVRIWITPYTDAFTARSTRSRSTCRHCRITEISYPVSTLIVWNAPTSTPCSIVPVSRSRTPCSENSSRSTRIPSRTGRFSTFSGRILSLAASTLRNVVAKTRSPGPMIC